MDAEGARILWAMLAFQIKHFVCDFLLQTQAIVQKKGVYGHFAGILHAGTHVVGSIPALIILGANARTIAILLFAEFVMHYHTDWLKARIDDMRAASGQDSWFWMMFGLDQFVHQLTYVAMIYFALRGI